MVDPERSVCCKLPRIGKFWTRLRNDAHALRLVWMGSRSDKRTAGTGEGGLRGMKINRRRRERGPPNPPPPKSWRNPGEDSRKCRHRGSRRSEHICDQKRGKWASVGEGLTKVGQIRDRSQSACGMVGWDGINESMGKHDESTFRRLRSGARTVVPSYHRRMATPCFVTGLDPECGRQQLVMRFGRRLFSKWGQD